MRRSARIALAVLVLLAAAIAGGRVLAGPVGAEPPHTLIDAQPPVQRGRIFALTVGGDLQAALDGARGGDTIVVPAGVTFKGPLVLPAVAGDGWIEIRSSRADELRPGQRVTPADAPKMARIVGGDGATPAVRTNPGAHHVRFVGIDFTVMPGAYSTGLILLGAGDETRVEDVPHHFVIDRCWIHGDPERGGTRGLALNARYVAVVDSYFSDWKAPGEETQAIAGWNGAGPFKIANNYLEAAGVNVLFGGADPTIAALVPTDIEIQGNHFSKPVAWRSERWMVKNLFELKNARRVLVAGNLLEHAWAQAQEGAAVLLSPRNRDGRAPWSVVEDVTFVANVVRGAGSGMKITGRDDSGRSGQTRRIVIRNNLFEDIDGQAWGGHGRLFTLLRGTEGVVIEHNTAFPATTVIMAEGPPHTGFVFRNNVTLHGAYGITGSDVASGEPTLRALFPGARVEGNVFIGAGVPLYTGNVAVGEVRDAGFVDPERRDWRLRSGSRFKGIVGGRDPGADVDGLDRLRRLRQG